MWERVNDHKLFTLSTNGAAQENKGDETSDAQDSYNEKNNQQPGVVIQVIRPMNLFDPEKTHDPQ